MSEVLTRPVEPGAGWRSGGQGSGPAAAGRPAMRPLSLRWNVSWTILGNGSHALCRWAMLIVLARLGDPEMVGLVVLAFALCAPVVGLANLGLRNVLVTDAREVRFADYLALRLVTAALSMAVVSGIALVCSYRDGLVWVILLVGLGRSLESVVDILHGLLQRRERMDRAAIGLVIQGALTLVLLALGVGVGGRLVWGMAGYPLAVAATLAFWDVPNTLRVLGRAHGFRSSTRLWISYQPDAMLRLLWVSLPLGGVAVLMALSASVPKYVIAHVLGSRELGIYAAVVYPTMLAALVVTAMGQAARPRLARYHSRQDRAGFFRLVSRMLAVAGGVGAVGLGVTVLAGGPVLGALYGTPLDRYGWLAIWVMFAAALRYLARVACGALDATRRFTTGMLIRAAELVLVVVLLPVLVMSFGLVGAAAGIAMSSLGVLAATSTALYLVAGRERPEQMGRGLGELARD